MNKKVLAFLTAISFMFSVFVNTAFAANYSDVSGHWAKSQIIKWGNYGILSDSSKTFRPNDFITRGEMALFIDNLMGYRIQSTAKFSDLGQSIYTAPILRANNAGIINGSNGKVRPRDYITREEAAVMICKAFSLNPSSSSVSFSDSKNISSWAKGYVSTLVNKGYISGRGEGRSSKFDPKGNITRAEAVVMIDNIVKEFCNRSQTYSNETINGTVVVNTPNATLKNLKIKGDLILAEGVGDGSVTLNSVKVSGNVIVKGGGTDSIYVEGSSDIDRIKLLKTDSAMRLEVSDTAKIGSVVAENGSDDIIISGTVSKFEVNSADNRVAVIDANIKNMTVASLGAEVAVDNSSKVDNLSIAKTASNAKLNIEGTVTNATINSTGVKFIANDKSKIANFSVARTASNTVAQLNGEITKLNVQAAGTQLISSENSNIKNMTVVESGKDSNIEINGILKSANIQSEGIVFTSTANSKVEDITVDSEARYTQLYIQGQASDIEIYAPNTELSVEGNVSNVNVQSGASSVRIIAERYSEIGSINSKASDTSITGTGKIGNVQNANSQNTTSTTSNTTTELKTTRATETELYTTATKATETTTERVTETETTTQATTEATTEEPKSPTVLNSSVMFDKNEAKLIDIKLNFDWGKGELSATEIMSVTVAGRMLDLNDGYSVSGKQITIYSDVMSELTVGNKSIVITFDDEFSTSEIVTLTVIDTTQN